jgi:hypothetical protein
MVPKIIARERMKKSKSKDTKQYPLSIANEMLVRVCGPVCLLPGES